MLIKCPACDLQFDCDPGKYLCKCGTTLDIAPDGTATVVNSDSFTHRMLDVASRESTALIARKRRKKVFRIIFWVAVVILVVYGIEEMVAKNIALKWQDAAYRGDVSAQHNLAHAYETGFGVEKNLPEALYWYRKAAENGDVLAAWRLYEIYEKGIGVKIDQKEAKQWRDYALYMGYFETLKKEKQRE